MTATCVQRNLRSVGLSEDGKFEAFQLKTTEQPDMRMSPYSGPWENRHGGWGQGRGETPLPVSPSPHGDTRQTPFPHSIFVIALVGENSHVHVSIKDRKYLHEQSSRGRMRRTMYIRFSQGFRPAESVAPKFHQKEEVSAQMMAVIDFFLGRNEIAGLVKKSDGNVYARIKGEIDHTHLMGQYEEIRLNWLNLIDSPETGLSSSECEWCKEQLGMIRLVE